MGIWVYVGVRVCVRRCKYVYMYGWVCVRKYVYVGMCVGVGVHGCVGV